MRNESVSRRQRDRDSFFELGCALDEADTNATMMQFKFAHSTNSCKYACIIYPPAAAAKRKGQKYKQQYEKLQ